MTDNDKKSQSITDFREKDLQLWKSAVSDVTPLKGKENIDVLAEDSLVEEKKKFKKRSKMKSSDDSLFPLLAQTQRSNVDQGRHEVDGRTAERLRRGQISIEAQLDLHGMNQSEARHALEQFVLSAHAQGKRCVLVITGKGAPRSSHSQNHQKSGVLKQRVPEWLREGVLHDLVLKIQAARANHGGEGALYVLLRRRR